MNDLAALERVAERIGREPAQFIDQIAGEHAGEFTAAVR
jgi:hypothetical protein